MKPKRRTKRKRADLQREDERLRQRRESLDRRLEQVENRDRKLEYKEKELDKVRAGLVEIEEKKNAELQRISGLTNEEAKLLLLQQVEKRHATRCRAPHPRNRSAGA